VAVGARINVLGWLTINVAGVWSQPSVFEVCIVHMSRYRLVICHTTTMLLSVVCCLAGSESTGFQGLSRLLPVLYFIEYM
jgi:hypothetical protein